MGPDGDSPGNPPVIRGRFEFIHAGNLAWILDAFHAGGGRDVPVDLLPGDPGWFLESPVLRRKLLRDLNLPVICSVPGVPGKTRRHAAPAHPLPSPDTIAHRTGDYIREVTGTAFFPDAEKLALRLRDDAFRGKPVVTTNGCFDILHPGHLETLAYAKSRGGILVVAINSDASVQRFKGPDRPIHHEQLRGAVLAHCKHVDFVTIFREDTPLRFLSRIRPAFHVKGGSFIESRIRAEKEMLARWGGTLVTFPMQGTYSTSRILSMYPPGSFPY